jgi:DNA-binding GntR family transcriptional regulator
VDRAHAEIRAAIIEGRDEPGVMLSESELAAALGMSRTPVRTALARLQNKGWVTIYSKRGALVRGLSAEELRYSADVRQTLQILGVERAGAEDLVAVRPRLEEMLAGQGRALEDGPFDTFVDLAIRFHRVFVELAGNPLFTEFYDKLRDRQAMMLMRSASVVRERATEVVAEHRRLMDLAMAGKVAEFAETLQRHREDISGRWSRRQRKIALTDHPYPGGAGARRTAAAVLRRRSVTAHHRHERAGEERAGRRGEVGAGVRQAPGWTVVTVRVPTR